MKRADFERVNRRFDEQLDKLNDAAIKVADGTLRGALLINGGAAVSVLAFIGTLATKELITVNQLARIADSLQLFSIGVASAVFGMGSSYIVHFLGTGRINSFKRVPEPPFVVTGTKTRVYSALLWAFHLLAFIAGLGCIVLFIYGMFSVRSAIEHLSLAPISQPAAKPPVPAPSVSPTPTPTPTPTK